MSAFICEKKRRQMGTLIKNVERCLSRREITLMRHLVSLIDRKHLLRGETLQRIA